MIVLGINAFHGDASACLVEDGKIIAAVAEERFTRQKHAGGFPAEAIKWCKGMTDKKIEHIAVSRDVSLFRARKIAALIRYPRLLKNAVRRFQNAEQIVSCAKETEKILGNKVALHQVEHHRAHLSYAYTTSDFTDCALLSIDGFGDFVSTSWGSASNNIVDINKRIFFPHSLGILYTALTQFLGFDAYGEEYKVMALAAYGQPRYRDLFEKIIESGSGGFKMAERYFMQTKGGADMTYGAGTPAVKKLYAPPLEALLGPARERGGQITQRHYDIAASLQAVTTNIVLHLAWLAKKNYSSKNLAVAGGVAQNSVVNGILTESRVFENVWFPSAPADDGTAAGAAAAVALAHGDTFFGKGNSTAFLGPEYSKISNKDLIERIVEMILVGKVVGWFEGRAEFGPRALGHRSIFADPRKIEMKERINAIVKKREPFRPFAPMVLLEDAGKYFEITQPSPNMMTVARVKKEWQTKLEAVTHIDGTARVQTIAKDTLPDIALLLEKWREKSGIGVLLNTSFNESEPIVNTPQEARNCFRRTALDALAINGEFLVK